MSEVYSIHHLPIFPHEKIDFPNGVIHDVPRMLTQIALGVEKQRRPLNSHVEWLGHEGGIRNAQRLLEYASELPQIPDLIEEGLDYEEGIWIGAKRLDTWHLAGSVVVKKGVSLITEKNEKVIDNGIIVEAVTAPGNAHDLQDFYLAGLEVANSMVDRDDEVVFSVEPAEPDEVKKSRLSKWINGGLTFDEEVLKSFSKTYAFRSDKVTVARSDFRKKKPVPAYVYTNQALDLTSS